MDVLKYADINPDDAKHMAQRLHRKKDDLNLVRKFVTVDKVEAIDEERSIVARVSTNDRDRDGEIVEPKGIDFSNYTKNPCLLWAHRYDMPAIGKALWTKTDDKGLICKFQFAPTQFADEIYALYKGGYQRAFSIGFIPMDFDSVEKVHRKVSLLEVSAVPVPSNQDALVLEAYTKGIIKSSQLMQDLNLVMTPDISPRPEFVDPRDKELSEICRTLNEGAAQIRETKKKAEEMGIEIEDKIVDAENNPGISDLFNALGRALNPSAQEITSVEAGAPPKPWYAVQDVFPVDFPNGHCIYAEYLPGRDVNPSYRQDYTYVDGRATMTGERVEVVVAYREKSVEIITKPETTENYHRIPVSTGHEDHKIRTITVSEKDGIKALYCVDCKEIATYLFDVDKFTMAEAEAWVEDHKKMRFIMGHKDDLEFYVYAHGLDVTETYGCPKGEWAAAIAFAKFGEAREVKITGTGILFDGINEEIIKEVPIPDLVGRIESIQAGIAAILAQLQVTPEPAPAQAVAPLPAPAPIPVEEIIIDADPDIVIEPSVPDKAYEDMLEAYIKSADFKRQVDEAIEVALAKIRGRVI